MHYLLQSASVIASLCLGCSWQTTRKPENAWKFPNLFSIDSVKQTRNVIPFRKRGSGDATKTWTKKLKNWEKTSITAKVQKMHRMYRIQKWKVIKKCEKKSKNAKIANNAMNAKKQRMQYDRIEILLCLNWIFFSTRLVWLLVNLPNYNTFLVNKY